MAAQLISFKLEEKFILDPKFYPLTSLTRTSDNQYSRGTVEVFGFDGCLAYEERIDDICDAYDDENEDSQKKYPQVLIDIINDCEIVDFIGN